jgi:hypothetical protein
MALIDLLQIALIFGVFKTKKVKKYGYSKGR